MTEYITKEQAIDIVQRNEYDWARTVKELEGLPGDVAPVRRGKWVDVDPYPDGNYCKYYKCSDCDWAVYEPWKYCTNCGAKMDED